MNLRRIVAWAGWAGATAVAVRGMGGSRNVLASLAWLDRSQPRHARAGAANETGTGRRLVLIVPLLREQRLIASTVDCLTQLAAGWDDASVVLVTSEREHADRQVARTRLPALALAISRGRTLAGFLDVLPRDRLDALAAHAGQPTAHCLEAARAEFAALETTPVMAARIAARRDYPVPVRHYHLPNPAGTMAQQINHAAARELAELSAAGRDPVRIWLAIYNADSKPAPRTLAALTSMLNALPDARIIQQSAVYTRGCSAGVVADGAALLQSRWTLAREVPRLRRQAVQARTTSMRPPPLAHCVGHGLFIRADTFTWLGGLPTTTMNEDLAFGYLACAAGIPIDPLPVLELADSPVTAVSLIRQTRQWFWSYPQYPAAARLAAASGLGSRPARLMLTAQGLARGALWLAQSPAIAMTLALPVATRQKKTATAAAAIALAAYYGVPFVALSRHLRCAGVEVRCGPRELLGGLMACLTSSIGPWWCIGQTVRARLTGARYVHGKTER